MAVRCSEFMKWDLVKQFFKLKEMVREKSEGGVIMMKGKRRCNDVF